MISSGEERFDIMFPKYKKGGHIVRKVTVNPTYSKYHYNFVDSNSAKRMYLYKFCPLSRIH